ncbi:DsbA family protein [Nitrosomonas communis]|uniref:DsbA family protein n=1 Tax=Nitrosomonas communis TaxID=44574 RepID=UPI003D2BC272
MNEHTLWYIADPMCSWCWGFSPVIETIRHDYGERLAIKLVVGGLRAGTTEALTPGKRAEILQHWHSVQRMTGQPFTFEGVLPAGFIYDTEPACRAVVSAMLIDSSYTFLLLAAIQHAFYVEQIDVTQLQTLIQLATDVGISAESFSQVFTSDAAKQTTQDHFRQAIQWGIRGFPTVIGQDVAGLHLLTNGYCTIETMGQRIDVWLNTPNPNSHHG